MKRIILISGVILIICVIISAIIVPSAKDTNSLRVAQPEQTDTKTVYTVKNTDGYISVYLNNEPYLKTETRVDTLPKQDEELLNAGINIYSRDELKRTLEDYCS